MNIKEWLQLFRAQTMPATLILIVVPYLAGGGSLFSIHGLGVVIFGILIHYFSFGENSILDTTQGYDTEDKSKQHHPLITGAIDRETAANVVHSGMVLTGILGLLLAWFGSGNFSYAMIFLFLWYIFGEAYNKGLSKTSILGFIPITLCFTSASMFGYFISGSSLTPLVWLIGAYWLFRIWYQIDLSGNIKDVQTGENNMLKAMGARIYEKHVEDEIDADKFESFVIPTDWIDLGMLGVVYGLFLTWMEFYVGWRIFLNYTFSWFTLPLVLGLTIIGLYFSLKQVYPTEWDREKFLKWMSINEVVWIYLLPIILLPIISVVEVSILLSLGTVYFYVLNKYLWEKSTPGV